MQYRTSDEARTNWGQTLDDVAHGEHVVVTRHGREAAVMVPPAWYRQSLKPCRVDGEESGDEAVL
jgi:prevent-host-death family protein